MYRFIEKLIKALIVLLVLSVLWSLLRQWQPTLTAGVEHDLARLLGTMGAGLTDLWKWLSHTLPGSATLLAGIAFLLLAGLLVYQTGHLLKVLVAGLGIYWLIHTFDLSAAAQTLAAASQDTRLMEDTLSGIGRLLMAGGVLLIGVLAALSLFQLSKTLWQRRPDKAVGTQLADLVTALGRDATQIARFLTLSEPKGGDGDYRFDLDTDFEINPL